MSTFAQRGFTLFELAIAVSAGAVIMIAALARQIEQGEITQAEVTANQMFTLGEMAQLYHEETHMAGAPGLPVPGRWPGQAGGCLLADVLADLVAEGFPVGANIGQSAWSTPFVTACDPVNPVSFSVQATYPVIAGDPDSVAEGNRRAEFVAGRSINATSAANVVTTNFPQPGVVPALAQVMFRVPVAGQPERNMMETNLDMNTFNLNNVNTVSGVGPGTDGDPEVVVDRDLRVLDDARFVDNVDVGNDLNVGNDLTIGGDFTMGGDLEAENIRARNNLSAGNDLIVDNNGSVAGTFQVGDVANFDNGIIVNGDASQFIGVNGAGESVVAEGDIRTRDAFRWGQSALLPSDESAGLGAAPLGDGIDIGGQGPGAPIGNSFINFHADGVGGENFNTQLINDQSGQLSALVGTLRVGRRSGGAGGTLLVEGDAQVSEDFQAGTVSIAADGRDFSFTRNVGSFLMDAAIVQPGTVLPVPTCPSSLTPRVFTSVSQAARGALARPMAQITTWAAPNPPPPATPTTWQINMNILTDDGVSQPPDPGFGFVQVIVQCG